MTCDQENVFLRKGKFHTGFVKRANSISIDAILYSAEYYEADTYWSFPLGSVSMIVHTHLFHKGSERVDKKNFIKITFKDLDFLAASDSELSLHAD